LASLVQNYTIIPENLPISASFLLPTQLLFLSLSSAFQASLPLIVEKLLKTLPAVGLR
jgi:hypothetical protein